MKSYYIKQLTEDQKELLSEKINLNELTDYDELLCGQPLEEEERDTVES